MCVCAYSIQCYDDPNSLYRRLFTGVCRLQGDSERVLFMCFDLIKKPLLVNELPVIGGVASVWPLPLARKPGFKVQSGGLVDAKELEKQVLSYTLEVVVMTKIKEKAPDLNVSVNCIISLYSVKWFFCPICHMITIFLLLVSTALSSHAHSVWLGAGDRVKP